MLHAAPSRCAAFSRTAARPLLAGGAALGLLAASVSGTALAAGNEDCSSATAIGIKLESGDFFTTPVQSSGGFTVTITGVDGNRDDVRSVDYSASAGLVELIVKGGPLSYSLENPSLVGMDIVGPDGGGGGTFGVSNVTFCFEPVEAAPVVPPVVPVVVDEDEDEVVVVVPPVVPVVPEVVEPEIVAPEVVAPEVVAPPAVPVVVPPEGQGQGGGSGTAAPAAPAAPAPAAPAPAAPAPAAPAPAAPAPADPAPAAGAPLSGVTPDQGASAPEVQAPAPVTAPAAAAVPAPGAAPVAAAAPAAAPIAGAPAPQAAQADAVLTVRAAAATPAAVLPFTGSDARSAAMLAWLMILAGALASVAGRRSRYVPRHAV